jgi:hypothetical protein
MGQNSGMNVENESDTDAFGSSSIRIWDTRTNKVTLYRKQRSRMA